MGQGLAKALPRHATGTEEGGREGKPRGKTENGVLQSAASSKRRGTRLFTAWRARGRREQASMAAAQPCAEDQYCTLIRESTEDAAASNMDNTGDFLFYFIFANHTRDIDCTRNNTHGLFTHAEQQRERKKILGKSDE